jgi:predicted nucleotidyltransferase
VRREHEERSAFSTQRLTELRGKLSGIEALIGERACIYTTGSYGRVEASKYSDLDVFVVIDETKPAISELDVTLAVAELIKASREFGLPDFSNEGEYLSPFKISELVGALGQREDDAKNTFTMRLLLLLESRPLVGNAAYSRAISAVVSSYWRDYRGRETEFIPAFIANYILRLWRTLCVNYEIGRDTSRTPKQKLKNYKLKHSRMMTCYSALAYLLNVYKNNNTVHPAEAESMAERTPLDRFHFILDDPKNADNNSAREAISSIVDLYDEFLKNTNKPDQEQIEMFSDPANAKRLNRESYDLGYELARLLIALGNGNSFLRVLLV